MLFTEANWRLTKFALMLALPVESAELWVLSNIPLGPGTPEQTGIKHCVDEVVLFLHLPVFELPLLNNAGGSTVWCLAFLFGYMELLLVFALIIFVSRLGMHALRPR